MKNQLKTKPKSKNTKAKVQETVQKVTGTESELHWSGDKAVSPEAKAILKAMSPETVRDGIQNPFNNISETLNDISNCSLGIQSLYKSLKAGVSSTSTIEDDLMYVLFDQGKETKLGKAQVQDLAIRVKNTDGYDNGTPEFLALQVLRKQVENVYKKMAKDDTSKISAKDQMSLLNVGKKLTGEHAVPVMKLTFAPLTEAQEMAKASEEEDQLSKVQDDLERDHKSWFMGLSNDKLERLTAERFDRFKGGEAVQSED
tara:strand:- start:534 stop:1304 length:771 start_codon:yes stop_codon:yes gene_type:complete